MNELTIIKQNGGAYIDSREVAEAIGKRHKNLLRDIAVYIGYMSKFTQLTFEPSDFFLESTYFDSTGRELPCFLLSKMGCEMVANKLTGEKGVLFTAAYVTKFNEMEAAEREAEIKSYARPRLNEFNYAVRNVLNGMSYCCSQPSRVMNFLQGVYEPLGVEVLPYYEDDYHGYYTATEIARMIGLYSDTGRPHGHAVSAIISKLGKWAHHAIVIPYGVVGAVLRYDWSIVERVRAWVKENNDPGEIPHLDFFYHVYYDRQCSLFDDDDIIDLDDDDDFGTD
jgi:Rha family phage regulatory protein